MNNPLLVRGFESFGDLLRNGQGFVEGNGALGDAVGERRPLDQFHHEGVHAGGLLEPVDRGDVGMIERRERLGLALEPRQAFGVRCERVRQDLDRDLAAKGRVRRPIHFAHSTDADAGDDFVDAESGARSEGQV